MVVSLLFSGVTPRNLVQSDCSCANKQIKVNQALYLLFHIIIHYLSDHVPVSPIRCYRLSLLQPLVSAATIARPQRR